MRHPRCGTHGEAPTVRHLRATHLAVVWLVCMTCCSPAGAELVAFVDQNVVLETDTVDLTLRASGVTLTSAPDFTVLEKDFEVLGTQTSSQLRSVNGEVEAWTTWTVGLQPKRTGTLTIAPFELDGQRSNPVEVRVKPLDGAVRRAIDEVVFFETEHEPESVYVQAQLTFTRRLYYAEDAQLYGDMPEAPAIRDAVVQTLTDPRPYTAVHNGRRYNVIEQRYAIFAEQSGSLTIPGASVAGSVRLPRAAGYAKRTGVRITAEPVEVRVKPVPAAYPKNVPWLPATDVTVAESFEPDSPQRFEIGRPVTRVLTLRARGTVASIVPPIAARYPDDLKIYAEPPTLKDASTAAGVVGTRTERQSLVVTNPGPLILPEIHVTWWDTVADELRVASVPPRRFEVEGQVVAPSRPPTPSAAETSEDGESAKQNVTYRSPIRIDFNPVLALIALISIVGWAVTWRRRGTSTPPAPDRQQITQDREPRAYRRLKAAVAGGDPQAVRAAFDHWLITRYRAPLNVAMAQFTADGHAREAVDELNRALFSERATTTPDYAALISTADTARRQREESADSPLPALYPGA